MTVRVYTFLLFLTALILNVGFYYIYEFNWIDFIIPIAIFLVVSLFFSPPFSFISDKGSETTFDVNNGFWFIIITNPTIHFLARLILELIDLIRDKKQTWEMKEAQFYFNIGSLSILNTISYHLFYYLVGNKVELSLWVLLVIIMGVIIRGILSPITYLPVLMILKEDEIKDTVIKMLRNGFIHKLMQVTPIHLFIIYFYSEQMYVGLLITLILSTNTTSILNQTVASIKNKIDLNAYKEIAYKDALTGAFNRRFFDKEMEQIEINKEHASIICTDIDKFKSINDGFNHNVGDQCLKKFTNVMMQHLPENAILIRAGGEEFTILIRGNKSEDEAIVLAEKIRKEIESNTFHVEFNNEERKINFTASFGIGYYNPNNEKSFKEILEKADNHLYTAKKTGRNKVVF